MVNLRNFMVNIAVDDVLSRPPSPSDSEILRSLRAQPPQNHFNLVNFMANLPGYADDPNLNDQANDLDSQAIHGKLKKMLIHHDDLGQ